MKTGDKDSQMRKREVTVPAYMYDRGVRMQAEREIGEKAAKERKQRRRIIATKIRLAASYLIGTAIFIVAPAEDGIALMGAAVAGASVMIGMLWWIGEVEDIEEEDDDE